MWVVLLYALLCSAGFFLAGGGNRVRRPRFAGTWYDGDPERLRARVDRFLEVAPASPPPGRVVGLIAPHAGYDWSGATAGKAYAVVRGARYERAIVLAPSHRVPFQGVSIPDVDAYATPLGEIPLDAEVCRALRGASGFQEIPRADELEHSLELQIPFLQRALPEFRLVPVLVGSLDEAWAASLAARLREHADARTLVVASSDFTHYGENYGFFPIPPDDPALPDRIREFDRGLIEPILRTDPAGFEVYRRRSQCNACGAEAIRLLLRMFPGGFRGTLLAYETSGALSGDWSSSVSYAALAISGWKPVLSALEERTCLRLARASVLAAVAGAPPPRPSEGDLTPTLREKGAAFVTLKRGEELRGCIGQVAPSFPLWEAVVEAAASATVRDERFPPVRSEETGDLAIEVTILGCTRALERPEDLDLGEEGAVLKKGNASAVFLPQIATERGWGREAFFSHLARKAGLGPDEWREAKVEAFGAAVLPEPGLRPA